MKSIFKSRASGSGAVMTNPRNKSESISETTKSFVYDWIKESIYGVKKQIKSKSKSICAKEDLSTLVGEQLKLKTIHLVMGTKY